MTCPNLFLKIFVDFLTSKYAVARTEHDNLVKSMPKIFSNFVAFSENPNFKWLGQFEKNCGSALPVCSWKKEREIIRNACGKMQIKGNWESKIDHCYITTFFYQATLLTTAVLEYHCSLMFLKSKGLNIKENKSRLLMYCVSLHDWYNDSTQALLPWHPIKCIHCCVITSVDVNTRWRTQLLRWEAK